VEGHKTTGMKKKSKNFFNIWFCFVMIVGRKSVEGYKATGMQKKRNPIISKIFDFVFVMNVGRHFRR
jgi:hypothetical protein